MMNKKILIPVIVPLLFLLLVLISYQYILAQKPEPIAVLKETSGEVFVLSGGAFGTGSNNQDLLEGDLVRTGRSAKAVIIHKSGFTSNLGAQSTLRVTASVYDIYGLTLARGWLKTSGKQNQNQQFRVATPVAVSGVRGTSFIVVGADDGSSVVSVDEGEVGAGIGGEVVVIPAGNKTEGTLAKGYGPAAPGKLDSATAEAWRQDKEKDLKERAKQVLNELSRLQKKEDADWQEIDKQVTEASQKAIQGTMSAGDRLFFRRVFDIEDRMSARMLLAIDLREEAGITPKAEADQERLRQEKLWEARDVRRKTWEHVEKGKPATQQQVDYLKGLTKEAEKEEAPGEMPASVPVLASSSTLFPDKVKGVYLGMSVTDLQKIRPNAKTDTPPQMLTMADTPVVYTEKQLSGGDWSKEGWFTGMYTFYNGKMCQGAFLAFTATEKLRKALLEQYAKLYGKPWRSRIEPDFAQAGTPKGSTVEWKGNGVEIVLVSRNVPMLQGKTRGLELRIRSAGYAATIEGLGQFAKGAPGQIEQQLKTDFPELQDILSKTK